MGYDLHFQWSTQNLVPEAVRSGVHCPALTLEKGVRELVIWPPPLFLHKVCAVSCSYYGLWRHSSCGLPYLGSGTPQKAYLYPRHNPWSAGCCCKRVLLRSHLSIQQIIRENHLSKWNMKFFSHQNKVKISGTAQGNSKCPKRQINRRIFTVQIQYK